MRNLILLTIVLALFSECKKEKYGNTRQKIRATTDEYSGKVLVPQKKQDLKYTQFGDFITSLTPKSFIGDLTAVRFHDDTLQGNLGESFMTIAGLSLGNMSADFTNNATFSTVPEINGDLILNPDGQGASFKKDVTFRFLWVSMGLNQIIELPPEYTNVQLNQFYPPFASKNGNILQTQLRPLYEKVEELSQLNNGLLVYFGLTDSTYIEEGTILGNAKSIYIRSSQFREWTMSPPLPDETKTYLSTIGFPNENIIHIYAGADNIPYTSDDIIVMEPKFWERLYVDVVLE